jgi:hypothetical protein
MRKFVLYTSIILGLFVSSCARITDNEDKGVKDILNFYGGYCRYSIGFVASTSEGKQKYFELEMSKSEVVEKYSDVVEMPASNIAYLFYHDLEKEKNNYNEIRSVVILKDGSHSTFKYATKKLAIVEKKMSVVQKIVNVLKSRHYEDIKPFLQPDTNYIRYDKEELIANLAKLDPQFGTIQEFRPLGFRFGQTEYGRDYLHISGALIRDKQNTEFSVDIDLISGGDDILLLQYKL